jgi:hypothetical protein
MSLDCTTLPPFILPWGELSLNLARLPHRDHVNDEPLIRIYESFGRAADIIASEVVAARIGKDPKKIAGHNILRLDAQAQFEDRFNEWTFGITDRPGARASFWLPIRDKLVPAAQDAVSACIDDIARIALTSFPEAKKGPLGINLSYKTSWAKLSNHQLLELRTRSPAA